MTCDHAVILAAGKGSRLSRLSAEKPKCLIEIDGQPIIGWVLRSVAHAGINKVTIVTGYKSELLERSLGDGRDWGLKISYFYNKRWRQPNGLSLYCLKDRIEDRVFLAMMSDHLLHWRAIANTASAQTQNCVLAVETDLGRVFDISDATKVRLEHGKPVAIGKRLRRYNAVDCGLFRFDHRIFEALGRSIANGDLSLTGGVRMLIRSQSLDVIPIGDHPWIDIDTPQTYRHALYILNRLL